MILISGLILFLLCTDICKCDSLENVNIATSLIRHLNTKQLYLLKPEKEDRNEYFLKMEKLIWNTLPWVYISVISSPEIPSLIQSAYGKSSKPSILLFHDERVIEKLYFNQISHQFDISSFNWILITNDYKKENYENIKIPYNCEFLVAVGEEENGYEIIELYDTLNIGKLMNFMGKWTISYGLNVTDIGIIQRRRNLHGTTFNISSNQEDPCKVQGFENSAGSVLMCIQYRLFNLFALRHNFSINWFPHGVGPYESTYYPKYLSHDMQFTIFSVNLHPEEGTTVIWPTLYTPVTVYTSYLGRAFGWTTYIYPFSEEMWLAVAIWFILSAAIISFAQYMTLNKKNNTEKGRLFWTWLNYVFLAFSAFCFQSDGAEPERLSLRILIFLIFLIPTALVPGYSAALTSYLAVVNERAPFTSLEGLSKAKDYKLGYIASFNLSNFLDRNSDDEVVRTLYRDIILPVEQMPIKDSDGLLRMCKEKFSFLCTIYTVMAVPPKCSYFSLDRPILMVLCMMPIKSDNPFKNLISRNMRDLIYSGVLQIEANRILPGHVAYPEGIEEEDPLEPIELENIIAIITLLAFGIFFSIFLLFLEWVNFRRGPTDFSKRVTFPN